MTKSRSKIAREEATRDPIFLFQSAGLVVTEPDMVDWCQDCEGFYRRGEGHFCESMSGRLTGSDLVYNDWAVRTWKTVSVWLTREEAEAHGRAGSHRYPEGWRVYCVNAEGQLAKVLWGGVE